jgi:superfamily I DNA and/or RNA helicase
MNVACSICLEPFTLTSDIYTTPCGHVFHYECIRKWLQNGNNHCSRCRQDCTIDEIVKLYFSENGSFSALENNNLFIQLESENLRLQQEVNALKARELGANQKYVALEEYNKNLLIAFCQSRSDCAGMNRVLKVQRSEIHSKNQKISELEAKCNQIAILARSTGGSEGEAGGTSSGGKISRFTKSDHDALAEIFLKIGQKELTKQGFQELYNFKQQNPHADLEPFLINSSEYFRNYIGKGNPIMFHSDIVD